MPDIIQITNVGMLFDVHEPPLTALKSVSLSVQPGEFVSLVGPSGCGKSTLLRIVADVLTPSSGRVMVAGKTPAEARKHRDTSFVFQSPALLPWRTVQRNVELPGEISDEPDTYSKAKQMLELVGLRGFEDSLPRHLSGGMQARVALARALCTSPKVLLMDEPFASLDELTRERMQVELLRICEAGDISVLFATHSLSEAVLLSDRVLVLSERPGTVKCDAIVPFSRPRRRQVTTSGSFIALVEQLRLNLFQ